MGGVAALRGASSARAWGRDPLRWLRLSCMKRPQRLKRSSVRRASEAVVTPVGGVAALRWWWLCGLRLPARSFRRSSGCFRRLHSNPRPVMDMSAPPPGGGHLPGTNFPEISNGSIGNFCKLLFFIERTACARPTCTIPLHSNHHIDQHTHTITNDRSHTISNACIRLFMVVCDV